jgi:23S rRNA pseudouridine2605 synthase
MLIFTFNPERKSKWNPVVEMGHMVKPVMLYFDGAVLTPEKKVYILLNKPKNFTTALDEGQSVMF